MHESSRPALKNLEGEGFRFNGMVDIFDAGPCVSCERDEIRSVRQSRLATVDGTTGAIASETYMIGTGGSDFRACIGPVEIVSPQNVKLNEECMAALKLKAGGRVRFTPLKAGKKGVEKETAGASD